MPIRFEGDDVAPLGDAVAACVDLGAAGGASEFQIARHDGDTRWFAHIAWRGYRISTGLCLTPTLAADTLAAKVLAISRCRCGRRAQAVSDVMQVERGRCPWVRVQARWVPGCNAPSLLVNGPAGDLEAIQRAAEERFGD